MSLPVDPPNVWVARNRWIDIPVPDIGEWTPTKPLSVVVPYFERPQELNLTLAGLSEQTYPHHLLQVIVADDGSTRGPPNPPSDLPFELEVVWQEDRGYGLARARNLGAKVADGDIIVFLDCDMIPERQHLEAHARWHHVARRLVTVGFRFHTDFGDETQDRVAEAVARGSLRDLARSEIKRPEWIEGHMTRTSNMLGHQDNLYLMMSGGNLGIDRDLYWEAGGNDESFTRWGGEDNEFGFRVMQLGAVVVPERLGTAWHQGEGHEPSEEELIAIWQQRPKLTNLIASRDFRRGAPGRIYKVPRLLVAIRPDGREAEEIELTVDSILASSFSDLVIGLERPLEDLTADWLDETYGSEARVNLWMTESELVEQYPFSPMRLSLPAGYLVGYTAVQELVDRLGPGGWGAVHLTLPDGKLSKTGEIALTRAFNRARHSDPYDIGATIGKLFGEWWTSGRSVGISPIGDIEEARAQLRETNRMPTGGPGLIEELRLRDEELRLLKSRRSIVLADAFGLIVRSRSWRDLKSALARLRAAFSSADRRAP